MYLHLIRPTLTSEGNTSPGVNFQIGKVDLDIPPAIQGGSDSVSAFGPVNRAGTSLPPRPSGLYCARLHPHTPSRLESWCFKPLSHLPVSYRPLLNVSDHYWVVVSWKAGLIPGTIQCSLVQGYAIFCFLPRNNECLEWSKERRRVKERAGWRR